MLYHPETGNIETKLLYEYENFWVAMLAGSWIPKIYGHVKDLADDGKVPSLRTTLFDCMMEKLIQVIERLDLSYHYELEVDIPGHDSVGYQVSGYEYWQREWVNLICFLFYIAK